MPERETIKQDSEVALFLFPAGKTPVQGPRLSFSWNEAWARIQGLSFFEVSHLIDDGEFPEVFLIPSLGLSEKEHTLRDEGRRREVLGAI